MMKHAWLVVVCAACGGRAPRPPANTAPAPGPGVARGDAACAEVQRFHREPLPRGEKTEIAYGGLTATYRGMQRDALDLEIFDERWLPDERDRATHALGTHCVRIVSSDEDQVVLDVAIQPAHEYDRHRCHVGCCRSERESRAPDGTEECCFCDDDPTP